jgi:hypothetical protein
VTYNSDFCVCSSDVVEEVVACLENKELVELDFSCLNFYVPWATPSARFPVQPQNEAVGRGKNKSFSESISTGTSFWLFTESIWHCKKTCISTPA